MKTLLLALTLALASCAVGPDWSPEVAAASNYYGSTPVYDTRGRLMGVQGGGAGSVKQHRSTMLVP